MIYGGFVLPDEPSILTQFEDEALLRDAHWWPSSGEVALDAGAAIGSYTIPALMRGARVVAVDPDTEATCVLDRIAALNSLVSYEVRNCALFDGPGYPPEMRIALETSAYPWLIPAPDVEWRTLDQLVAECELTRLDWIKIDVEGAELGVLRGGQESLARFHPRLLIEDHTGIYSYVARMDSARQCRELLAGLGYVIDEVPFNAPVIGSPPDTPPPRTYMICGYSR